MYSNLKQIRMHYKYKRQRQLMLKICMKSILSHREEQYIFAYSNRMDKLVRQNMKAA